MATTTSTGGVGEAELTQTQKEILVELRKSLGTLRVINEVLVKTIGVVGARKEGEEGGEGGLVEAQKEVAREVEKVIGSAVGRKDGEGESVEKGVVLVQVEAGGRSRIGG